MAEENPTRREFIASLSALLVAGGMSEDAIASVIKKVDVDRCIGTQWLGAPVSALAAGQGRIIFGKVTETTDRLGLLFMSGELELINRKGNLPTRRECHFAAEVLLAPQAIMNQFFGTHSHVDNPQPLQIDLVLRSDPPEELELQLQACVLSAVGVSFQAQDMLIVYGARMHCVPTEATWEKLNKICDAAAARKPS